MGIPKNSRNGVLRTESRKAIKIPELFMFSHENLIARFLGPLQLIKPVQTKAQMTLLGHFLPTR
jgi:hypothetical protein